MVLKIRRPKGIRRDLARLVGRAIGAFNLIEEGDRILVALSGGKDSWTLLYTLLDLQRKAPIEYQLAALTVHPGTEGFDTSGMEKRLRRDNIPHEVIHGKIEEIVNERLTENTNPCSFCSRLRRGIIYSYASKRGWNKIALGHHMDDFIETLLMNMFFNGSIKGMSPDLLADDKKNRVIRPMVYVKEEMTREYAKSLDAPILDCRCPRGRAGESRREWVKALIGGVETEIPQVRSNLLHSMARVRHRHLLPTDGP